MINFIKKHKRFLIVLLIITVVISVFFAIRRKPFTYKTTSVQKSSLSATVSASGKVVAKKEAKLHFQTLGRLAWVGVKEGDSVREWQAIASLDRRELEKNLIKTLRDYSKERNDFDQDRVETYKYVEFSKTVQRILEKNQWDLDKAVLDVEIKDIALQYSTLITPISGIVTDISTPVAGVNITASDTFSIVDPSSIIFEAEVDETDIGLINPGQQVTLSLDSYPDQKFIGSVSKIGFTAVTTSSGGTAFVVEISLPDNSNMQFKPGMNGDSDILLSEKQDVLTVPFESVLNEDGKNYVYILEMKKTVKKEVQIGIEGDSSIEIISGLNENEIIINNANDVK